MKNNETSGDRVRQLRKYLGLTQEAFSEEIGMTHGNVSKIEKNEVSLSNAFLNAIKRRYACNPDWVITGEGNMFITPEEFIAIGINFLGERKYGEGLVKILNDPQFAELWSFIVINMEKNLADEFREFLQQVAKIWQQGDERTREMLAQFIKTFSEVGKKSREEKDK